MKKAVSPILVAISLVAILFAAGLARSREVRTVYLDVSALEHFDFGLPGFALTPLERAQFESVIKQRLEDEYSHWNVDFTLQPPSAGRYKTVRFREAGREIDQPPLGFSLGFWGSESCVYFDAASVAPVALDTAIQLQTLRATASISAQQRPALVAGRIHTLAELYGAIAAHEVAHSFGVVGHFGEELMAAAPKLSAHLGVTANWLIAVSLG